MIKRERTMLWLVNFFFAMQVQSINMRTFIGHYIFRPLYILFHVWSCIKLHHKSFYSSYINIIPEIDKDTDIDMMSC